jgi:hypothetical protein
MGVRRGRGMRIAAGEEDRAEEEVAYAQLRFSGIGAGRGREAAGAGLD